ncbi:TPA: hypothetical protein ACPZLH_002477 [Yersinia enterocolitica]
MNKHIEELSIEEIIKRLKTRVALSDLLGPDELTVPASVLGALIARLEAAELELIKPLPIGELINRLEGQTYEKWFGESDVKDLRERAEAAEARLLVPVEFPDSDIGIVSHIAHWYSQAECEAWVAGVEFSKKQIIKAGYLVEGGNTATIAPAPEGVVMRPQFEKPLERCAAARDGECSHKDCPQLRDNEPMATGRHCPIDNWDQ